MCVCMLGGGNGQFLNQNEPNGSVGAPHMGFGFWVGFARICPGRAVAGQGWDRCTPHSSASGELVPVAPGSLGRRPVCRQRRCVQACCPCQTLKGAVEPVANRFGTACGSPDRL